MRRNHFSLPVSRVDYSLPGREWNHNASCLGKASRSGNRRGRLGRRTDPGSAILPLTSWLHLEQLRKTRQEELRRPQGSLPCALGVSSLLVLLFLPPHPAAARTCGEHRTNPPKLLLKKGLPPLSWLAPQAHFIFHCLTDKIVPDFIEAFKILLFAISID